MSPEELRARYEAKRHDYFGRASNFLIVMFEDGNTDEEACSMVRGDLAYSSSQIKSNLEAIEKVLGESTHDANLLAIVLFDLGQDLEVHDIPHARAWVREKADLIRAVYEEEVHKRGGQLNW